MFVHKLSIQYYLPTYFIKYTVGSLYVYLYIDQQIGRACEQNVKTA